MGGRDLPILKGRPFLIQINSIELGLGHVASDVHSGLILPSYGTRILPKYGTKTHLCSW